MKNPFRYFDSSPEVIRLVVMMYVKYPLSLRNVEDLLAERGLMVSNESIRRWVLKFGPAIARNLRETRPKAHNRWHLDEMVIFDDANERCKASNQPNRLSVLFPSTRRFTTRSTSNAT